MPTTAEREAEIARLEFKLGLPSTVPRSTPKDFSPGGFRDHPMYQMPPPDSDVVLPLGGYNPPVGPVPNRPAAEADRIKPALGDVPMDRFLKKERATKTAASIAARAREAEIAKLEAKLGLPSTAAPADPTDLPGQAEAAPEDFLSNTRSYLTGVGEGIDIPTALMRSGVQLGAMGMDQFFPREGKTYSKKLAELLAIGDNLAHLDETPGQKHYREFGDVAGNIIGTLPLATQMPILKTPTPMAALPNAAPFVDKAARVAQNTIKATPAAIVNRAPGGMIAGATIQSDSGSDVLTNMALGGALNVAAEPVLKAVGYAAEPVLKAAKYVAGAFPKPKLKPKQLAEALRRQAVEETANKTLTSPVLEERKIRRDAFSNQGKDFTAEAAAKRTSEAGERAAAAALELKRMDVPPIGKLASPEELGVPLQAEARAQKAALKKDSDAMWKKLTAEMDALEASKTGVGQTISYGQKYKDFIKELNKRASATAGDPQDRQYAKLLLEFVDEKYPMRVKPSHLMEMKRYIAETAFDPASGFKAIASQRKKEYVARLDDMLRKHFTDPKTGTSPYDLRNKNYENFITKQEKLYSSRFGRKLTGYDKFGVSLNTPTEAAVMVLRDPQAVRAALAQGVSVPTIEATMTRNLANEFDGKTPEAIAKLLQPGGNLYSKLEIPQLARVKEETRKYLINITDQKQNSLKIDSYDTVAEKFANEARKLEADAVKSGNFAKDQERKIAVGEKILEAKRAALLGKLNDAKGGDIKEMMALAKEAFVGNEPKLSEIRRVEKMNVSDDEKRKRIRRILIGAGAALGLAAANTRIGSDTIALVTGE